MKDKLFIDTDVILDVLLNRKQHSLYSQKILSLIETNKVEGYTSALIMANIYYIIRKIESHNKAIKAIEKIRAFITILPFTDKEIGEAVNAGFKDVEDGMQYFIALNNNLDVIITRNIKDFNKSILKILTPQQYLNIQSIKKEIL
jgi:predicted nucleic acid-binding protein